MIENLLGDISPPPTLEDIKKFNTLNAAIFLSKMIVGASIGFIGIWLLLCFIIIFFDKDFDKGLKILPALVPYWGTITGTILGFLFGRKS